MARSLASSAVIAAFAAGAACLASQRRAYAEVPVQVPAPGAPARIRVEGNSVVGRDAAGAELWRVRHASVARLQPRQGEPLALGRLVFYGHHSYLMVLDPAAGRVVRRVAYPGRIIRVEPRDASLAVFVEYVTGEDETETKIKKFRFDAANPVTPAPPIDGETAIPAPMLDAHRLLEGFDLKNRPAGAELAVAKGVYDKAFAVNPTNPWFMFDKGVLLRHLGRREGARAAFRAVVTAEGAPAFDFLRISALLASMDEMSESDLAFERGYAELIRSGVEPELILSREAFIRLYAMPASGDPGAPGRPTGPPATDPAPERRTAHAEAVASAQKAGDVDGMERLSERVWRLAPRCRGVTYAFAGLAEHLQKHGRAEEARIWFARAREAARLERPVGVRQAFDAGLACLVALALLVAVVFGKAFGSQRKDLGAFGGWLRSWRWPKERFCRMAFSYATRKELLGLIVMAAAGFGFSYLAVRSARATLGSLPEEVGSGVWCHPRALKLFGDLKGESGELFYGIARQQEGSGSAAEEIYKPLVESQDPAIAALAENNLGVIRSRPEHFKRALELEPRLAEASYNLGGPVDSTRAIRAHRYLSGKKLMALPSGPLLAATLRKLRVETKEAAPVDDPLGRWRWLVVWLTLVATASVGVLALPFLLIRNQVEPPRARTALAGLGYVVPGTSERLAPVGALILAGWIYCLVVFVSVLRGGYAPRPGILPEINRVFGTAGGLVFTFETALSVFAPVAFVGLWVLNGILLARAARRAGPPTALPAKPPPKKAAAPEAARGKGAKAKAEKPKREEPKAKEPEAKGPETEEPKAEEREEGKEAKAREPKVESVPSGPAPAERPEKKEELAGGPPSASAPEAPEKKAEEKAGKKIDEKIEKKAEERPDRKAEERADGKIDEKIEKKAEEKTEAKVDQEADRKAGSGPDGAAAKEKAPTGESDSAAEGGLQ